MLVDAASEAISAAIARRDALPYLGIPSSRLHARWFVLRCWPRVVACRRVGCGVWRVDCQSVSAISSCRVLCKSSAHTIP